MLRSPEEIYGFFVRITCSRRKCRVGVHAAYFSEKYYRGVDLWLNWSRAIEHEIMNRNWYAIHETAGQEFFMSYNFIEL